MSDTPLSKLVFSLAVSHDNIHRIVFLKTPCFVLGNQFSFVRLLRILSHLYLQKIKLLNSHLLTNHIHYEWIKLTVRKLSHLISSQKINITGHWFSCEAYYVFSHQIWYTALCHRRIFSWQIQLCKHKYEIFFLSAILPAIRIFFASSRHLLDLRQLLASVLEGVVSCVVSSSDTWNDSFCTEKYL